MTRKTPPKLDHQIQREIINFLVDRRAERLAEGTISYYQSELTWFANFLEARKIVLVEQISAEAIREYMIKLSATRNPGGMHAAFRAIKAWLNWYAVEIDDETWRNPIKKVKPPKVSSEPLPGVSTDQIMALLTTCRRDFLGDRDRAIILTLLDTGLRRAELLALNLKDLDLKTGAVLVRSGKGNKSRTVFAGNRARQAIIRYLRHRVGMKDNAPLWITQSDTRLTPSGLRQILRRRSLAAGIPEPTIHDFRRAFAIESLRNGADLVTLMRLMGHTSTAVLRRYLHLVESDLARVHAESSPADNL